VHDALAAWFADYLGRTIAVDALTLCAESAPGAPFRLHSVHPLHRPADRPRACRRGRSRRNPMSRETVLSNARIVLDDEILHGSVHIRDGEIADITAGPAAATTSTVTC